MDFTTIISRVNLNDHPLSTEMHMLYITKKPIKNANII